MCTGHLTVGQNSSSLDDGDSYSIVIDRFEERERAQNARKLIQYSNASAMVRGPMFLCQFEVMLCAKI